MAKDQVASSSHPYLDYARSDLWKFFKDQILWGIVQMIVTLIISMALLLWASSAGLWQRLQELGIISGFLLFLASAAVTMVFMFLWRWAFIAPRKLYQEEKAKNEKKIPDLQPLLNAIKYIQDNTRFGQFKSWEAVFEEVKNQAIDSNLEIIGRFKHRLAKEADSDDSVVSSDVLKSCVLTTTGELGTLALVEIIEPIDWVPSPDHLLGPPPTFPKTYYIPTVSMKAIKRVFDDR